MRSEIWKVYFRLVRLITEEEAQDLSEYALMVCLISTAGISFVQSVASSLVTLFTHISTTISHAVLSM